MIKTRTLLLLSSLIASIVFIRCNTKSINKEQTKATNEIEKAVDYEAVFNSLVSEYKPEITSQKEFKNFKNKSNYEVVIEAYDVRNPPEILGGKSNIDNIRYYELPTNINTHEYGNNGIIFGDLNNNNKRDCIISVFRSDGYNEVTFFYVFINQGDTFKLADVANENDICGCKEGTWPNLIRYQKIENGVLEGISQ
jgi:hypothetical protein